jgi:hypothetical protein
MRKLLRSSSNVIATFQFLFCSIYTNQKFTKTSLCFQEEGVGRNKQTNKILSITFYPSKTNEHHPKSSSSSSVVIVLVEEETSSARSTLLPAAAAQGTAAVDGTQSR